MVTRSRTRSQPTLRFNRIVQLERRTVTRDSFGSEIEAWAEEAEVWASVNQTGTSEKFENDAHRAIAKRSAQITIRWRPDVKETMRVVHEGLFWDIEGIAEIGRRAGLTLFCQTDVSRKAPPGYSGQRSPSTPPQVEPLKPPPDDPSQKPPAPSKR